jgi:hypothetical protein
MQDRVSPMTALYQQLLGPAWGELSPAVQRLHAEQEVARGTFRVQRGVWWLARALGALMRMPAAAEAVAVTLRIERRGMRENWRRVFGAHPLASRQWAQRGVLVEALGPVQCRFRLVSTGGALGFEQVGAAFGIGWLAFPLPRFLAPQVHGRASVDEGTGEGHDTVHVVVTISAPGLGLIVGYDGHIPC